MAKNSTIQSKLFLGSLVNDQLIIKITRSNVRWLEVNQNADLEELQERRKVAEAACGPCITRLYQVVDQSVSCRPISLHIASLGGGEHAEHGRLEHGRPNLQCRRWREEEEGQGEEALGLQSTDLTLISIFL